jgi:hypothetical protein
MLIGPVVLVDLEEPPVAFEDELLLAVLVDVLEAEFDVASVVGVDGFWHWNV